MTKCACLHDEMRLFAGRSGLPDKRGHLGHLVIWSKIIPRRSKSAL